MEYSLSAALSAASKEDIQKFYAALPDKQKVELLRAMAPAPLSASALPAGLYSGAGTDEDSVQACVAKFDAAGTVYQNTLMRPCLHHWAGGPENNFLLAMGDGSFYCSQTRPSLLSGGKVKPGGLQLTGSGRILSIEETLDPQNGATWIFKVAGSFQVVTDGMCANPMICAAAHLPLEEKLWDEERISVIKEGMHRLPQAEHEFRVQFIASMISSPDDSKPFADCVADFVARTVAQSVTFAEEDYFGFLKSVRRQGFPYIEDDEEEVEAEKEVVEEEEEEE
eukprot:TRINITY_DN6469_c0_g1_i1.p1 TRINITY_DN6469_c0_g1~~TRINITY_DN6469_c0_g1_i1.p1  ORF type:complete len:281 (+),score=66.27 TRINITY_DN6469_c0_g1_i1:90-932(+)